MAAPIRFYFDFVSTYSYPAVFGIDAIARRHGREVDWRVVSLPHVFRAAGTVSPREQPAKLAHNQQDVARACAMAGLPFSPPPDADVKLARLAFHRLHRADPARARDYARAVMAWRFGQGRSVAGADELLAACATMAAPPDAAMLAAAQDDPVARDDLQAAFDAAIADGMFGAPYCVADGERFWGHDRVTQHLDWWLARQAGKPLPAG